MLRRANNRSWIFKDLILTVVIMLPVMAYADNQKSILDQTSDNVQNEKCFARDGMSESRDYVSSSFQWENDSFLGQTDHWYTNGMKYTRTFNPDCNKGKLDDYMKSNFGDAKSVVLSSWSIGQNMYTPTNITNPDFQERDRPWTGWLYFGRDFRIFDIKELPTSGGKSYRAADNRKLEMQVGRLGEWAMQDRVQRGWHELMKAPYPAGWKNQNPGKAGIVLHFRNERELFNLDCISSSINLKARVGGMVGNVVDQFYAGMSLTFTLNPFVMDDATFLPISSFGGAKQITPTNVMNAVNTESTLNNSQENNAVNTMASGRNDNLARLRKILDEYDESTKLKVARERWYAHHATYVFLDVETRYVRYNTFLVGTLATWKPWVGDLKVGVAYKIPHCDATVRLSKVYRSPETSVLGVDSNIQRVTQASIEWDWGWIENPRLKQAAAK